MKMRNKTFFLIILWFFILNYGLLALAAGKGTLSINFIGVNASDQGQELEINQTLPRELEPSDVLETGDLKLQYDLDKKVYFITGKIQFQPKESKTFKIKVNDVWYIQAEEIDVLKQQLDQNVETLKDQESYAAAQEARDEMDRQIDYIFAQQNSYSDNIERRIEEYRAYRQTLEQIRNNIYSMDFLKYESKALKEIRDNAKTLKFVMEVKNPSSTEERKVTQKHYLPDEVREEHIIDSQGFDIRFDEVKNRSYLTKEETFAPGEIKKYQVVLKDIWQFPMTKVDDVDQRAIEAKEELQNTAFQNSANFLFENIQRRIEEIRQAPTSGISVESHIGIFRANDRRYVDAREDLRRIEQMLAIIRAKKLEELQRGKVKNVLQRLKALRGLRALSEMLFKKAISVTTTWKIIFGIILFVAGITTIHFIIWARRSGRQGEEFGPSAGEKIRVVPKPGQAESGSEA